jgi:hypothetical protein
MYKNELHLSNYGIETCINTNVHISNDSLTVAFSLKGYGEKEIKEFFAITFLRDKILGVNTNSVDTHTGYPSPQQIQEELAWNMAKSKFFEVVVKTQSQPLEDIWDIIDNKENPEEVLFNTLFS